MEKENLERIKTALKILKSMLGEEKKSSCEISSEKIKKKLDEFFKKVNNPNYIPTKSEYRGFFLGGDKKITNFIKFISKKEGDLSQIAIIEVGSSNAAGLIFILITTSIKYAIAMEFDYQFNTEARRIWKSIGKLFPEKELLILDGDAPSNSTNVNVFIRKLYADKKIKGISIICQSVLHELPFRSIKDYNLYKFLLSLMQDHPNILLYIKEPTGLREYQGDVQLSIPLIDVDYLFRFATIVNEKLSFSNEIIKGFNFINLDAQLAGEVIKKLVYLAENSSVDSLLYEMGESHSALNPENLNDILCKLFNPNSVRFEYVTSETFKNNFLDLNVSIHSVNNNFKSGIIPKSFVVFTAWR